MSIGTLLLILAALSVCGYAMGRSRALSIVGGNARKLHSLPSVYGYFVALWCGLPALLVAGAWLAIEPHLMRVLVAQALPAETQALAPDRFGLLMHDVQGVASGVLDAATADPVVREAAQHYLAFKHMANVAMAVLVLALAAGGLAFALRRVVPHFRARQSVEKIVRGILVACSTIAILTTIGIVLSLLFESIRFFARVPPLEFLFGLEWSPQTALRPDQVGSSGAFGAVPLFVGTILISLIAMLVAAPVGLLAAVYMAEYAPPRLRAVVKPLLEILAGVPTVVYGFFAALTVAPLFRGIGFDLGLTISSESALAAGIVMGIMIIPFVSSISDDVISAVPQAMRDGSLGIGATQSETIKRVILPAALPGIVGGLLLAVSRAIGETMIVVMAAGLAANLTANPFEAVTTVTVQIVTLLIGDQEFDSAKTLAAFALGLTLFFVTLLVNIIALTVVNRYREQYE